MNFFSVRKAWGWAAKFAWLLLLCSLTSQAASLRIGLLSEAPPFLQQNTTAGILADEANILFKGAEAPKLIRLNSAQDAITALNQKQIDLLISAAPPATALRASDPLLAFPLSRLLTNHTAGGVTLRFPAIPENAALSDTQPGASTLNENIQRLIRGEARQLIAPTFLLNQYFSNAPVTTLEVESATNLPTLHFFAWALPARHTLIAEVNQRISSLNQEDASRVERKWLLPAGSVFSARYPPTAELAPPIELQVLLPDAPPPWVQINEVGEIRGVWYNLLSEMFPPSRFALTFALQTPAQGNTDAPINLQIIADDASPDPLAVPFDALNWGIVSAQNTPLPGAIAALKDKRIAVLRYSPLLQQLDNRLPAENLVLVDTLEQGLTLLHAGGADGVMGEIFSLSYVLKQQNEQQLRLAPLDLPETPLWFNISAADTPETQRVRQVLTSYTRAEVESSRARSLLTLQNSHLSGNNLWLIALGIVTLSAVLLALVAFSLAQTQRRQRERDTAALHNALTLWQTLMNNAPVPLFVCDPSGSLTRFNAAFSRSPFLPHVLPEGMPLHDLPLGEIARQLSLPQRITLLNSTLPTTGETTLANGATTLFWWLCSFTDNRGRPHGIVGGWVDISEKASLTQALNQALSQAERVSEEKSTFLARMSHDIRTPLNAVLGLLELERDKNQSLEIAWQAAVTLRDLIGDILDLSRIEAGELQLDVAPHNLHQALTISDEIFARSARARGLHWHSELAIPTTRHYLFDKTRLSQVVANLLSNAIKYTHQGEVSFTAHCEDEHLTLIISDSGIGIPAEALSQLGEAWFQLDQSTPQSSGLGLAICYQLVALMSGTLDITSKPGQGTRVEVRLPLEMAEDVDNEAVSLAAPLPQLRVMVVDDFAPNLTVLRLQLEKFGMQVTCCDSAEQALDVLAGQPVDLLITDCQMPLMDGYVLVQTLLVRDLLGQTKAPATMLGCTANALPREEERARHAGMDDLLRKPLTADRLLQALTLHNPLTRRIPDLRALYELANQQPEVIARMQQQMHDAINDDLKLLAGTLPPPDDLSRIAHRLKASWSLLGVPAAFRACLVMESLNELLAEGMVMQEDIVPLASGFTRVMQESLKQLDASLPEG
ncbi:ATP-binding protein [Pantoea cypripedii]|uniref:ATP-binding protein n=1 Tax=Pantoea cypripedii TaxID=55209 RepID=UPI002FC924AE